MHTPNLSIRKFFTAGNATATLHSKASGKHFTFKASRPKDERDNPNFPTFVSVLTGNDNENDFTFLGTIFADGTFRHGRNSRISADAPSAKGFEWLWRNADKLPEAQAELMPTCNCARCGRKLTVPTSIENALGPECVKHFQG